MVTCLRKRRVQSGFQPLARFPILRSQQSTSREASYLQADVKKSLQPQRLGSIIFETRTGVLLYDDVLALVEDISRAVRTIPQLYMRVYLWDVRFVPTFHHDPIMNEI